MSIPLRALAVSLFILVGCVLPACKKAPIAQAPDYGRPLPRGASALRKITDPAQQPDLTAAFRGRDAQLLEALDRSIEWYRKPSIRQFFPMDGVGHERAQASAAAFRAALAESAGPEEFRDRVRREFDVYQSVGWDGRGGVLFTGYYTPVFRASRTPTGEYRYPLYRRPADLVSDPVTGKTLGRRVGDAVVPYPTRAQIEDSGMLAGHELVWLPDKLDAFIIQVNGSARLNMADGSVMHVGYAGTNGHEYTSIGRLLVRDGKIERDRVSLPRIRDYFLRHPEELDRYTRQNDRFVFFQEYDGGSWPAGSLGFKVTPMRTLATDKEIFPRGGVVLVVTRIPVGGGGTGGRFEQLMLDQDTGGAIRAAGRGDIYMGIGPDAGELAGRQNAEGRLYYYFLKE